MQWKHKSQYIMRRDHYECQECRKKLKEGKARKISRATQVHHIVPYDVDPSLGLDDENLEAICDRCHNIIHGRVWSNTKSKKKKPATVERW